MSYEYSTRSRNALNSAHEDLQKLFNEVIKTIDCTVVFGYRSKVKQEEQFDQGRTKLHFPKSKHR